MKHGQLITTTFFCLACALGQPAANQPDRDGECQATNGSMKMTVKAIRTPLTAYERVILHRQQQTHWDGLVTIQVANDSPSSLVLFSSSPWTVYAVDATDGNGDPLRQTEQGARRTTRKTGVPPTINLGQIATINLAPFAPAPTEYDHLGAFFVIVPGSEVVVKIAREWGLPAGSPKLACTLHVPVGFLPIE